MMPSVEAAPDMPLPIKAGRPLQLPTLLWYAGHLCSCEHLPTCSFSELLESLVWIMLL